MTRLTRQESRQITRDRILQAAADLFAEYGVNGTSVEQIVEQAGYTRGAFYGNFEGKHDLVLTLLEQRTRRELADLQAINDEAASFGDVIERLRAWHRRRDSNLVDWLALRTELWLYGMRDPVLAPELARHEARSREAMARALADGFAAWSVAPPAPVELLALVVHSLDDGMSIQRVLAPDDSGDDAVVDAVELLMKSWLALALARAGTAEPGTPDTSGASVLGTSETSGKPGNADSTENSEPPEKGPHTDTVEGRT